MNVRGQMVLYVVLALGVSGGVAGAATYHLRDDLALDRRGEKATAAVTEIRTGRKNSRYYQVAFTTTDGRAISTELRWSPQDPRPGVGETLRVTYDASHPELARDARPSTRIYPWVLFPLSVLPLLWAVHMVRLMTTDPDPRSSATWSGSAGP